MIEWFSSIEWNGTAMAKAMCRLKYRNHNRTKLQLHWLCCTYSTVQYSIVQYSTVQHSTVQYNAVQYSTVPHHNALSHSCGIPNHSPGELSGTSM